MKKLYKKFPGLGFSYFLIAILLIGFFVYATGTQHSLSYYLDTGFKSNYGYYTVHGNFAENKSDYINRSGQFLPILFNDMRVLIIDILLIIALFSFVLTYYLTSQKISNSEQMLLQKRIKLIFIVLFSVLSFLYASFMVISSARANPNMTILKDYGLIFSIGIFIALKNFFVFSLSYLSILKNSKKGIFALIYYFVIVIFLGGVSLGLSYESENGIQYFLLVIPFVLQYYSLYGSIIIYLRLISVIVASLIILLFLLQTINKINISFLNKNNGLTKLIAKTHFKEFGISYCFCFILFAFIIGIGVNNQFELTNEINKYNSGSYYELYSYYKWGTSAPLLSQLQSSAFDGYDTYLVDTVAIAFLFSIVLSYYLVSQNLEFDQTMLLRKKLKIVFILLTTLGILIYTIFIGTSAVKVKSTNLDGNYSGALFSFGFYLSLKNIIYGLFSYIAILRNKKTGIFSFIYLPILIIILSVVSYFTYGIYSYGLAIVFALPYTGSNDLIFYYLRLITPILTVLALSLFLLYLNGKKIWPINNIKKIIEKNQNKNL